MPYTSFIFYFIIYLICFRKSLGRRYEDPAWEEERDELPGEEVEEQREKIEEECLTLASDFLPSPCLSNSKRTSIDIMESRE